MKSIEIPETLSKMNEIFEANGFEAYLVGGAVRDLMLGKEAADWDLTTNATPEQVTKIFHKVIPTGIAHGTVTVHFRGKEIEVTTFRCDQGYSDGRHPDAVTYAATIEEDLSRRDLTINAIAASLKDGSIIDPFGGQKDIEKKCIRTVGKAYDRFMEDGLRPIRALRFSSQLKFKIEEATLEAISNPDVQKKIMSISMERFRDELTKILKSDEPSTALHQMESTGILRIFIPELADCRGCTQADIRGFHEFDVLDHNLYACDGAPKDNLIVRLAALFHDIGKKEARTVEKYEHPENSGNFVEIIHFHKHDRYSTEKTKPILIRLKFPNTVIDQVLHLIEHHMFYFETDWTDAAVRRFIVRVKPECIEDLFKLRLADIYGEHRLPADENDRKYQKLKELHKRTGEILAMSSALSMKDLAISGQDLIAAGFPAGREMGAILKELFQRVLDNPDLNTREELLKAAEDFSRSEGFLLKNKE